MLLNVCSDNQLSGVVPTEIAIPTLTTLSLHSNQLVGPLPKSLTKLRSLHHFSSDLLPLPADTKDEFDRVYDYIRVLDTDDYSHNDRYTKKYINTMLEEQDNLLSILQDLGGDPSKLQWTKSSEHDWNGVQYDRQGCVCSLIMSDLGLEIQNAFPESLEFLSNILFLDLSYNSLSGLLPKEIFSLVQLQYLYLNNNEFDGALPQDISRLDCLKTLNLSHNRLSGPLQLCISQLKDIEILCLSNNKFEGIMSKLLS